MVDTQIARLYLPIVLRQVIVMQKTCVQYAKAGSQYAKMRMQYAKVRIGYLRPGSAALILVTGMVTVLYRVINLYDS